MAGQKALWRNPTTGVLEEVLIVAGGSGVPTFVASGSTYTVEAGSQVYAPLDILVDGDIVFDGEVVFG